MARVLLAQSILLVLRMSVPLELWTLVVCLCPYNRVMLLFFEKRHLVDVPTHTPAPRLRLFSLSIGGPR